MERELREAFKQASVAKPVYEPVDVPGIGRVHVKRLTAGEKDAFEGVAQGNAGNRALALLHGSFDERGERIFEDDDKPMLDQLDPELTDPVVIAFLRLNRYTKAEQDRIAKNLTGQAVPS
jgi:hypothetical protein